MTDLIDLNYRHPQISSNLSSSSQNSFLSRHNAKIFCINQVVKTFISKFDKINIKTVQTYLFWLDQSRLVFENSFYSSPVKILGMISLGNGIFSLRIQFFDYKGTKIHAKSSHHRTVISNFVFEINAQLENFMLQFNPVSGQFSFVFNVKAQFMDKILVSELVEYGLNSYFEECEAHFYVLNLLEFTNQKNNQYLKNIHEDFQFLKRWILQRKQQNKYFISKFEFYKKSQILQKHEQETQNQSCLPISKTSQIKTIQKYLYPQTKQLNKLHEPSSHRLRHAYKTFKKYYKEQEIFLIHMKNKNKFQNLLIVTPKITKSLEEVITGKSYSKGIDNPPKRIQNFSEASFYEDEFSFNHFKQQNKENQQFQNDSKSQKSESFEEKLRICDKNSGKNFMVRLLHHKGNSKNERFILQKLCKFQSYLFINQYIELQNMATGQKECLTVNDHPKRSILSQFLKKNNKIVSFSSRIDISINLIQIIYTLHLKSKIQNYFPLISIRNLQISRKLYLNFKVLSTFSVNPLFELLETICFIVFNAPLLNTKQEKIFGGQIIKGDEIQNKSWGLSVCIYFLKFFLIELYRRVQQMTHFNQLRMGRMFTVQDNQQYDQWKKHNFARTCQQLLVIFCHFRSIYSRGYEQKYNFEDESESED